MLKWIDSNWINLGRPPLRWPRSAKFFRAQKKSFKHKKVFQTQKKILKRKKSLSSAKKMFQAQKKSFEHKKKL